MTRLVKALIVIAATGGVALAPLSPVAASAKPTSLGTASVQLGAPVSCTYPLSLPVSYTWTGFAGSNDTAAVWLGDNLGAAFTSQFQVAKVRGSGGTVTHTFDGLVPGAGYRAWGELLDDHGNVILGSLTFSSTGSC